MGVEDIRRQALNVYKMRLLGAEVVPGRRGHRHARRRGDRGAAPLGRARRGHVLRARLGRRPAPVPDDGARVPERHRPRDDRAARRGRAPAACPTPSSRASAAASNAIGTFYPFIAERARDAAPAARRRRGGRARPRHRQDRRVDHARASPASCTASTATCSRTRPATRSRRTRSRPGSTTPASAPSTRTSRTRGSCATRPVTDAEALVAFELLCRTEGIIPAIESSHALALLPRLAEELGPEADGRRDALRARRQGHRHRAGGGARRR